jgi:hypothetical protein
MIQVQGKELGMLVLGMGMGTVLGKGISLHTL